jgi:hypothetical protein
MEIAASLFKRTVWSALFPSERVRFKMRGGQTSVEIPGMSFPRKRFGKLRLRRVLARLTKFEEEGCGGQGKAAAAPVSLSCTPGVSLIN